MRQYSLQKGVKLKLQRLLSAPSILRPRGGCCKIETQLVSGGAGGRVTMCTSALPRHSERHHKHPEGPRCRRSKTIIARGKSIYRFCPFVHILSSLHHYNPFVVSTKDPRLLPRLLQLRQPCLTRSTRPPLRAPCPPRANRRHSPRMCQKDHRRPKRSQPSKATMLPTPWLEREGACCQWH